MKPLRTLTLCLLLLSSFATHAKDGGLISKDFTGTWTGVLHVVINGQDAVLPFAMEINKTGYGEYTGTCLLGIELDGEKVYNNCKMSGSVVNEQFSFKDKETIKYTMPSRIGFYWCTKTGTLHFEKGAKGEDVLMGPVNGESPLGGCLPATAELRRKKK